MNILGISAGYHDAAATVINSQGDIVFAGHAERYSKKKNDANIDLGLIRDACGDVDIDHMAYYETPWKYSTMKERMKSRNVVILQQNVVILPRKATILHH